MVWSAKLRASLALINSYFKIVKQALKAVFKTYLLRNLEEKGMSGRPLEGILMPIKRALLSYCGSDKDLLT